MKKLLALAAVATFALAGTVRAEDPPAAKRGEKADKTSDKTIAEIAAGNEKFSTLVAALKAADWVEQLNGDGPFTVFAPTNEAFEKIPKEKLDALLKDKKALAAVLTAHVVKGKVLAADVMKMDGKEATSLQGTKYKVAASDKGVMIGDAKVTKTDIMAKNGVIHVIDTVLMPSLDSKEK